MWFYGKNVHSRQTSLTMHYLKCESCDYLNEVNTEYLIFCNSCNKKLSRNFTQWSKINYTKSFDDYLKEECIFKNSAQDVKSGSTKIKTKKTRSYLIVSVAIILFGLIIVGVTSINYKEILKAVDTYKIASSINENQETNWQTFTNTLGGFSVQMPGTPTHKDQTVTSEIGDLVIHMYQYQPFTLEVENYVYNVSYADYPGDAINSTTFSKEELDVFYQNVIAGTASSIEGTVIESKPTVINGFEGREVRFSLFNEMTIIRCKFMLKDKRLYMVQTASSKENENNKESVQFFNSFKLI